MGFIKQCNSIHTGNRNCRVKVFLNPIHISKPVQINCALKVPISLRWWHRRCDLGGYIVRYLHSVSWISYDWINTSWKDFLKFTYYFQDYKCSLILNPLTFIISLWKIGFFSQVHFLCSIFFFLKQLLFFPAEEMWFSNCCYFCIYITLLIY